jgi:hypothetical protein
VNAYNRLVNRTKEDPISESEPLDANYYEKMEKDCFGEVARETIDV